MATIIHEDEKIDLMDHQKISETAKEIGVPFGCENGMCGACIITIEDGLENVSEKNEKEEDLGLEENQRLACQSKIKTGTIKINF
tara:strand:+ start:18 stop:272 length:255 start_codon:yes stop_codon:yes gene_type:complete